MRMREQQGTTTWGRGNEMGVRNGLTLRNSLEVSISLRV